MFGEEMTELNAEVADAVGELFNTVSGQARVELEKIV
jgi:chemotaxis protein CheX